MIGIIALIFLGPRKLPEMARKLGKIMADLRNTTNEFKETWEREVNFDEEARALRLDDDLAEKTEPRSITPSIEAVPGISAPAIKEIDPTSFEGSKAEVEAGSDTSIEVEPEDTAAPLSEKSNWL